MIKRNWLSSILISALMLMCSVTYASPFTNGEAIYSDPVYEVNALTADTADPVDAAVKPDNSGIANWRNDSWAMYAYLDTVPEFSETVLACGYQSELVETPSRIPIAV